MKISQRDWNNYKNRLAKLSQKAADEMQAYVDKNGLEDRDAIIAYAYGLSTKYGEGAAELACQMYDETAAASRVSVRAAEPAATATYGETAKAINGCLKQSPTGQLLSSIPARLTKQAAADTTLKNAIRDGAEWAWVPSGDTCAFCITLASRGWQRASKNVLKGNHATHIHAHCDCQFSIRFDGKSTVDGYDPEVYREMYYGAEGSTSDERINSLRRRQYAEMFRRRVAKDGHEIIDKPTFNKLTKKFRKNGGTIVTGKETTDYLERKHVSACYISGNNVAIFREDPTVSDVLEEMYHAEQDRKHIYGEELTPEVFLRREIDAQKYLLSATEKFKIPIEETSVTKANLKKYEEELSALLGE